MSYLAGMSAAQQITTIFTFISSLSTKMCILLAKSLFASQPKHVRYYSNGAFPRPRQIPPNKILLRKNFEEGFSLLITINSDQSLIFQDCYNGTQSVFRIAVIFAVLSRKPHSAAIFV